jgi:hypothetical protein
MEAASFYGGVRHKIHEAVPIAIGMLHKKQLKETETSGVWIKKV